MNAVVGSPSQFAGVAPARASRWLINPVSGLESERQINPIATTETRWGTSNTRRAHVPVRARSKAVGRARVRASGTVNA